MDTLIIFHSVGQRIQILNSYASWLIPSFIPESILLLSGSQGNPAIPYTICMPEKVIRPGQIVTVADSMGTKVKNITGKLIRYDEKNIEIEYNAQGCTKTALIHNYCQISVVGHVYPPYISWFTPMSCVQLSYIFRQISWCAHYSLLLTQTSALLFAKAIIFNNSGQGYCPSVLILKCENSSSAEYNISPSVCLPSGQKTIVPLFQCNDLSIRKVYRTELGTKSCVAHRVQYQWMTSQFYPPGQIYIYRYDQNKISTFLGTHHIQPTPMNQLLEIDLGWPPSAEYAAAPWMSCQISIETELIESFCMTDTKTIDFVSHIINSQLETITLILEYPLLGGTPIELNPEPKRINRGIIEYELNVESQCQVKISGQIKLRI